MSNDKETKQIPITTPLEAMVADSMMKSIGAEARNKLIADSLTKLMREEYNQYTGRRDSPLGSAFNSAVEKVARETVERKVRNDPEVNKAIEAMVVKVAKAIINHDSFTDLVTMVLTKAIDKVQT